MKLEAVLGRLGVTIESSATKLQEKVEGSSDSLATAILRASGHLTQSLDEAAGAARLAADASEKHARSLVCATWALFAATAVLVLVTALALLHH